MDKDIVKKLHEDLQEHQRYQENAGEMFNVFEAFDIKRSELAWSAVIAYLLNPKGKHCCGDVFLKLFIKQLPKPIEFNTSSAFVSTEWDIKELGRIDIIVTDEDNHQAIIIENKIFASDQPEQIARYYRYATEKMCYHDFRLLYLTRFGSKPSKESTCGIEDFDCISYIDTVKGWLEECSHQCLHKPRLHDVICQAKDAINDLCKQTIVEDFIRCLIEESLNMKDLKMRPRISLLEELCHSEYADVNEQCTKLIKQYQKERFDELTTSHFNNPEIQPLEGVLDGYWKSTAYIREKGIKSIQIMHNWKSDAPGELICIVDCDSPELVSELGGVQGVWYKDNNDNPLYWSFGLDDYDGLYSILKEILDVVCKIS